MKRLTKSSMTLIFSALLAVSAQSALADVQHSPLPLAAATLHLADADLPWVAGKVVKISEKRGIVTIAHEAISNLEMPAMTMGFKVKDKAVLSELNAGDMIELQASTEDGKLSLLHFRRPNS